LKKFNKKLKNLFLAFLFEEQQVDYRQNSRGVEYQQHNVPRKLSASR